MRGNNFKEKKVVPLIFTQFWIRSHLNQLDRLTPQDVYITTCSFDFDISGSSLQCTVSLFFQYQITTWSAIAPRPKYCSDGYCIWQRCHALFVLEGFSFSPLLSCNYSEAAELLLSTKYVFLWFLQFWPPIFQPYSTYAAVLLPIDWQMLTMSLKVRFYSEDTDVFVIPPNSRTFYFPNFENLSFGNWKLLRNCRHLKVWNWKRT